jgi:CBS domain-containing protein
MGAILLVRMSKIGLKRVSEIMEKSLVAISPNASIKSAIKLVKTSGVNTLFVIDKEKLVGIVGEDDLLVFVSDNSEKKLNETIQSVIKKPVFAEVGDTVAVAIGKTIDHNLTRLPIVDSFSNMKCVGVVTATDLLKEASLSSDEK